ncbi:hypothetical protein [Desulfoplanes formicivorans]|uniref:Uncharacterized protein n=1 Tax=Desulfoplanes formicivorans TaxID=1592317 RepID=A0A194AGF4_9BACT|nr:hypothetical protein [Desulfoplanes formicivorans]GAU07859.1 hypothetical protein DPF_0558 [Desulfoplanes formicivorans]
MSVSNVSGLRARVYNCLQTILDLESDLDRAGLADNLLEELNEIKGLINHTHTWDLKEADVLRIERATADFLRELEMPLSLRKKIGSVFRVQ